MYCNPQFDLKWVAETISISILPTPSYAFLPVRLQ